MSAPEDSDPKQFFLDVCAFLEKTYRSTFADGIKADFNEFAVWMHTRREDRRKAWLAENAQQTTDLLRAMVRLEIEPPPGGLSLRRETVLKAVADHFRKLGVTP